MKRREMLVGGAASFALLLTGCQTTEMIDTQSDWQKARSASDQSIVFGRILWIENGAEREIEQNIFGWFIEPRLKRLEDSRTYNGKVDAGGHFRWSVPAGTYLMDRISYRDPATGYYLLTPKVAFKVPESGKVYYVGTLRADAVSERGFLGTLSGDVKFSVEDRISEERRYLQANSGISAGEVRRSLMIQDDRLPESFDTTAEAQVIFTLLGAAF